MYGCCDDFYLIWKGKATVLSSSAYPRIQSCDDFLKKNYPEVGEHPYPHLFIDASAKWVAADVSTRHVIERLRKKGSLPSLFALSPFAFLGLSPTTLSLCEDIGFSKDLRTIEYASLSRILDLLFLPLEGSDTFLMGLLHSLFLFPSFLSLNLRFLSSPSTSPSLSSYFSLSLSHLLTFFTSGREDERDFCLFFSSLGVPLADLMGQIRTKFFQGGKENIQGGKENFEIVKENPVVVNEGSSASYEDLFEKEGMSSDVARPFAENCFSIRQRKILNFLQKFSSVSLSLLWCSILMSLTSSGIPRSLLC